MTKISQLSDIGASLAGGDEFVIRDVSDATTPNKKVTSSGIIDYVIGTGSVTGFTKISAGAGPLSEVACTFSGSTGTITMGTASAGSPVERLRIDSSGRVGVGTSSPGSLLDLRFATSPATDNGDGFNVLRVFTSSALAADTGGAISLGGVSTSGGATAAWGQIAGRKENATSENYAGYLQFATNNSVGTMSERMRIDSSGQLIVAAKTDGTTNGIIYNVPYTGGQANAVSQALQAVTGTANALARINMSTVDLASTNGSFISFATSPGGGGSPVGDLTQERLRIDPVGRVGIGTSSPTTLLDVNADTVRVRTARTPASATATGDAGEICWDASYIYVCTATNTWKRAALSTW